MLLSMQPAMVHSLVDSFFEMKKAEVKSRLRDQLDQMVDGLFGELVTTVKELLISPSATDEKGQQSSQSTQAPTPTRKSTNAEQQKTDSSTSKVMAVKSMPGTSLIPGPSSAIIGGKRRRSTKSGTVCSTKSPRLTNEAAQSSQDSALVSLKMNVQCEKQQKTPVANKKYACSSCDKSFAESSKLKRHEATHSGVKPYRCKWSSCTFGSGDRSSTIRHIRHIHLKDMKKDGKEDEPGKSWDPGEYLEIVTELLK